MARDTWNPQDIESYYNGDVDISFVPPESDGESGVGDYLPLTGGTITGNLDVSGAGSFSGLLSTSDITIAATSGLQWDSRVYLYSPAANVLEMRNGTNGQTLNVYGTYTDANNYRRLRLTMSNAGVVQFRSEGLGSGATGNLTEFYQNGSLALSFNSSLVATFASNVLIGGSVRAGAGANILWDARSLMRSPGNGVIQLTDSSGSNMGSLVFGALTPSFFRIKCSGAVCEIRLGDDSGFATLKGILRTDTDYTAGAPTPTGYLVIEDGTGAKFKIPAEAL